MEKKKKEHKIVSSTSQETETNDLLTNTEQNPPNLMLDAKNDKTGSPSHENVTSMNQQSPTVHQSPYTSQPVELHSPVAANRCQQLSHLQPNSASNQVQQGQPPLHLSQSTVPFWLPTQPGYQVSGINMPTTFQTFTPLGTINGSWQGPAMIGLNSSSNQPQVPNLWYPVGYAYPGFPGPNWDPSSWYVQGQQSQLPSMYACPRGYGYSSSMPPPMPGCSPYAGQSFQRGIIRPTTKLSQKHQQLWEAQSVENVQLWTIISQMQSELADYKSRLIKLEAETSSLKPAVEEPVAQVTGTALSGKPSKRGRPRKSAASVDVLPTSNESYPRAQGRKPAAICKVQSSEARTLSFEKVILNRVEDNEKACHFPAVTQQENDEKIYNITTNNYGNLEVNGNNMIRSTLNNQDRQENPRIQICENADVSKTAFSILSEQAKATNTKGSSAAHIGTTANVSFQNWPSIITPESCGRNNKFYMISQGFYDSGSVIRQGEKHISGWSFVNDENTSEQLEDVVVGLGKDDNDEEMGYDGSSDEEEIAPEKE